MAPPEEVSTLIAGWVWGICFESEGEMACLERLREVSSLFTMSPKIDPSAVVLAANPLCLPAAMLLLPLNPTL
eukprot:m.493990 g.493990  ORF g.493990 m.493990 type:complete len:73 (-) comp122190_c0_seq1:142-360(-)